MSQGRASIIFDAAFLVVGAAVCLLAGLGWFATMNTFPWILGLAWAVAGLISIVAQRRKARCFARNLLLALGAIFALL